MLYVGAVGMLMSQKRKCCSCFSCLSTLLERFLPVFLGFGTGKPLAAESTFPQSPGLSAQDGSSSESDTEPGSPRAAQQSLDESKEKGSPKKTGENSGTFNVLEMKPE